MIRLPGVSGSCGSGEAEKEQGWVTAGALETCVRHGGKPLVAWKQKGNICKYSHPAF